MGKFVLFAVLNASVIGAVSVSQYRVFDLGASVRALTGNTQAVASGSRAGRMIGGSRRSRHK